MESGEGMATLVTVKFAFFLEQAMWVNDCNNNSAKQTFLVSVFFLAFLLTVPFFLLVLPFLRPLVSFRVGFEAGPPAAGLWAAEIAKGVILIDHIIYYMICTLTGRSLDRFSLGNHTANRSRLIPVTVKRQNDMRDYHISYNMI